MSPRRVVVLPLLVALGMLWAGSSHAQAPIKRPHRSGTDVNALESLGCGWAPAEPREPYFAFNEQDIYMPEGVFLLIREGTQLGALQFTKLTRGGVREGDRTEYVSYYQGDGSGSLTGRGVSRRVGQEDMKLDLGYAPFSIERGKNERVRVGPWQFGGRDAGHVEMYPYGTEFQAKDEFRSRIPYRDPGFEYAATSAQDVGEVDARDGRLQWFRYVEQPPDIIEGVELCLTRRINLAVSGLPK